MLLGLFYKKRLKALSDEDLIEAYAQNPSSKIIGEIFERYGKMLFGVNLKYLKNKENAEDILMQTFEKLPFKLAKSEVANLRNWLYTMAKNDCLQFIRKKNPTQEIANTLMVLPSEAKAELEAVYLLEAKLSQLEKAIGFLKSEQKVCIDLFYLKKMSYDEVAIQTGFELKKVKSFIQNGKRNLKLILAEKDVFKP
ncbi:RNA polymerase subunit sigma-24 [Putridiphycobacter roseus]|uniref:RNA polymerase subunit sigma-24 n=1 Tax=Putridiphycobacter roseus TaxID=2219161 RepID=A0A2W1N4H0_9FLAO|nr:sigma-70 family RNA polymerase sigma factor [Putridiphycobacter roseus]PZE17971.1 RNA polymerase subunit sigma-24 [Putridiphycobacter roseus]